MINKLSWIISNTNYPYYNLSLEKFLFDHVANDEIILYLWQNKQTVVCGRNQNIWKECNVTKLQNDGGHAVRRLSGGGAVYHDLGNLNFTFLVKKSNYDVNTQLEVIINACKSLDIDAVKTGRNDITVNEKKFSGNAFFKSGENAYHHGTLMVSVDKNMLSAYLNVDKEKLISKGVSSVKSRVANLTDFNPNVTIDIMTKKMIEAFEKTYGLSSKEIDNNFLDDKEIDDNVRMFKSKDWLYGRNIDFSYQIKKRYAWGDFDMRFNVECGKITSAALYSDANDEEFIRTINDNIIDSNFSYDCLAALVEDCCKSAEHTQMASDIKELLADSI